ncbi:acetyltransferase [Lusitaniella coriacea LEGE 07157]|uniref:Acetyltransferase n=1 Tax=Lusitaniella coriacea LEGE 07157 TaxID=945747 RepID=A0A8J7DV91_9CYAN|nr:acetyltransferase [Lusitaniella coriacea]MBE9115642.1 acetyltransferase [Lusitaniella coriacea LEGE 07157]
MTETTNSPTSREEIESVIAELEQYRERIVESVMQMAQKVKFSKKKALKDLENHPEIAQIDAALAQLRSEKEAL